MALKTTSTAARSRSPLARSFPDQHHRDAARESDDDHAGAVGGVVGEEEPREREHEQRPDHPREEQRHAEEAPVGDAVGLSRNRAPRSGPSPAPGTSSAADRAAIGSETVPTRSLSKPSLETRDQPAEPEPERHRQRDPKRQEAIERRQLLQHRRVVGGGRGDGVAGRRTVSVAATGVHVDRVSEQGAAEQFVCFGKPLGDLRSSRCAGPRSRR